MFLQGQNPMLDSYIAAVYSKDFLARLNLTYINIYYVPFLLMLCNFVLFLYLTTNN